MPAHAAVVDQVVRTGKRAPKRDPKTLLFKKYTAGPAAALPGLRSRVYRSKYVGDDWGMMKNDDYGDCTTAASGHSIQITTGTVSLGSHVVRPTDAEVLDMYWGTGHPPIAGADDNGRYELDVLNYWHKIGIGGHKLHAFAQVGSGDFAKTDLEKAQLVRETRYAMQLFGFAYIGLALPKSAQRQTLWKIVQGADAKPWSWGGHAVIVVDYDRYHLTCVTWGTLVEMTWGFYKKYCDESYAVILPEWLDAEGKSVQGFDLDQLDADLKAIAA